MGELEVGVDGNMRDQLLGRDTERKLLGSSVIQGQVETWFKENSQKSTRKTPAKTLSNKE